MRTAKRGRTGSPFRAYYFTTDSGGREFRQRVPYAFGYFHRHPNVRKSKGASGSSSRSAENVRNVLRTVR